MTNLINVIDSYGLEHVIIEHEDGSTTSMLKSIYDEQQEAIKL